MQTTTISARRGELIWAVVLILGLCVVAEDVPITDDVSILQATKPGREGGGDDEYGEGEQVNGMTIPELEGNELAFMPFRHRISRHTHGTLLLTGIWCGRFLSQIPLS